MDDIQKMNETMPDTPIQGAIESAEKNIVNAEFVKRGLSFVIDCLIIKLISKILVYSLYGQADFSGESAMDLTDFIGILVFLAYFAGFTGYDGQTIGKMILKIKTVQSNGKNVDYMLSLKRAFAYIVDFATLGLGFLFAAFRKDSSALHDMILKTRVISIR